MSRIDGESLFQKNFWEAMIARLVLTTLFVILVNQTFVELWHVGIWIGFAITWRLNVIIEEI